MDNSRVRVRYCHALMTLALEKGINKTILSDFKQLLTIINESDEFRAFLKNNSLLPSKKKAVVHTVFKDKLHPLTIDFLNLLISYNREGMLKFIVYHYIETSRNEQGIRKAVLTTATDIGTDFKKSLFQSLENGLKSKLDVEEKVNPDLIGGFILRVDDLQLDASIRGKLTKIKEALMKSD